MKDTEVGALEAKNRKWDVIEEGELSPFGVKISFFPKYLLMEKASRSRSFRMYSKRYFP